ncbi:MAG: peptidylprolyl isomerase [bacterium]
MPRRAGGFLCLGMAGSLVLIAGLSGCDSGDKTAGGGGAALVIAEVNGAPITQKDLYTAMLIKKGSAPPAGSGEAVQKALVEELVERRLILQRFRETGGYVEEARVRALVQMISSQYGSPGEMEKILREEEIDPENWRNTIRETLEIDHVVEKEVYSKIKVSEDESLKFYQDHRERYHVGRRWRVRQIVVGSEEEARRLRARIIDGAPFALLARRVSSGPERERGGDLGLFSSGQLPESVEPVIKTLKKGEISRVVQTPFGYHLFQVTETRSAGIQSYRAVREKIRSRLLAERGREALRKWISGLKKKATIRFFWGNLDDKAAG